MLRGIDSLQEVDPFLFDLLSREYDRQVNTLSMLAASSFADPSVFICKSMGLSNVTTEGYPGRRYHAGCGVVDEIEELAIERAKQAFQAKYANVQPHSGTSANEIIIFNLLKSGDTILALELNDGGHLSHGARASVIGKYFNIAGYRLNEEGFLDYDEIFRLADQVKPKLIISGASAYPRVIDFRRFREIADSVGAYLLADVSHIAGLIVAAEHPSSIDHAHFTTSSTYKQLYGPRGGLILIGRDYDSPAPRGKGTLAEMVQKAVFPFFQGTPDLASIAAKARSLGYVLTPEFKMLMKQIVVNTRELAKCLIDYKYKLLTGGSDNHMVLVDTIVSGLTGIIAERALEDCGIIINKNKIPGDKKSPLVASGIRLGTNSLALRGMGGPEMEQCAELTHIVLSTVNAHSDTEYTLDKAAQRHVRSKVRELCEQFPIPNYPLKRNRV